VLKTFISKEEVECFIYFFLMSAQPEVRVPAFGKGVFPDRCVTDTFYNALGKVFI